MAKRPQPLFLARASYRKRRLRDGARLLPIFGFVLLLLPLLWVPALHSVVPHWAYVFGLWAVLIVLAGWLSRRLAEVDGAASTDGAQPKDPSAPGP